MREIIISFTIFYSLSLFSQDIKGKWLVLRDDNALDVNWVPNMEVLEFEEKQVNVWNYDSIPPYVHFSNKPYSLSNISLSIGREKEDLVTCPIRFFDNNIFQIDYMFNFEDKKLSIPVAYVRLLKTKLEVDLNSRDNLVFKSDFQNIEIRNDLKDYLANTSKGEFGFEETYFIENIEDSLILSMFVGKNRKRSFLIKSLDNEKLVFFGIPEKPFLIELKRIN